MGLSVCQPEKEDRNEEERKPGWQYAPTIGSAWLVVGVGDTVDESRMGRVPLVLSEQGRIAAARSENRRLNVGSVLSVVVAVKRTATFFGKGKAWKKTRRKRERWRGPQRAAAFFGKGKA